MSDVQQPDPNAPWSPDEMTEVSPEERAELANIQASLPVLQEVLDWFDEQIADALNPNIIGGVTPTTDAEKLKDQVLFAQRESKRYSNKRNEFVQRFANYMEVATESDAEE